MHNLFEHYTFFLFSLSLIYTILVLAYNHMHLLLKVFICKLYTSNDKNYKISLQYFHSCLTAYLKAYIKQQVGVIIIYM